MAMFTREDQAKQTNNLGLLKDFLETRNFFLGDDFQVTHYCCSLVIVRLNKYPTLVGTRPLILCNVNKTSERALR